MKKYNYVGKTKEEALELALYELKCSEKDIYYQEQESKQGLFKSKKIEIEVFKKEDIIEDVKEFLSNIIGKMGIDAKFEVRDRDDSITITAFCENNNILIGKQGRTINALSLILKQYLQNELGFKMNILFDVGDYKLKNQKRLERLAKNVARDVVRSGIEVKLDPMNSYERRIIHTILSENTKVKTESTGEEPNRCVVIKKVDA